MSAAPLCTGASVRTWGGLDRLRVAFVGSRPWLDGCCPAAADEGGIPAPDGGGVVAAAGGRAPRPDVTVVFDPPGVSPDVLAGLRGRTLGVLVGGAPSGDCAEALRTLDRVVSFRPELTGTEIPGGRIWRAIPPPIGDQMFTQPRRHHRPPRAMTIGRSTPHREAMLMPAKHHHDLLQVIHGLTGGALAEVLGQYDVGVYVPPATGGGFGAQVGTHLAAGQLLVAAELRPAHGLERGIDYVHADSPGELVWVLERLRRFPEMHERIRVRGRIKAEQYRASRLFRRLAHDLLADVAAFGSG